MTTPAAIPVKRTSFSFCPGADKRRSSPGSDDGELPRCGLRSRSIPISTEHMVRTPSEVQLCIDEAIAQYRDDVFYTRVVEGIRSRKAQLANTNHEQRVQQCLSRLARSRRDKGKFAQKHQQLPSVEGSIDEDDDEDDWSPGLSDEVQDIYHRIPYPTTESYPLNNSHYDTNAVRDNISTNRVEGGDVHEDIFEFEL